MPSVQPAPDGAAPTRAYRSELREAQARRTRERILESAAIAFSATGYQATTLAAIAREAGVSTETVKSAGSKSDLLIRSFEVQFAGVEGAESLTETDAGRGVLDLPTELLIDAVVAAVADANARGSRLWTVLLGAALSDPLVDEALRRMLASRRADFIGLAGLLVERGVADPGLDVERAAAELSFLMSPESYEQLVRQSGWSDDDYRRWMAGAIARAIGTSPS
ncbi:MULTISPECIES: TetR/AcrR family transcriptional regulator [Microbacterium]|uniref:TetR/AcrR family transcriptional regulator n=1 Tax=Microbacterium TaxID=33882 RepID=UPI000D65C25C|nr:MULTISPECIES: TetR/AcrR family transcriptional regulator [Microbacterium]